MFHPGPCLHRKPLPTSPLHCPLFIHRFIMKFCKTLVKHFSSCRGLRDLHRKMQGGWWQWHLNGVSHITFSWTHSSTIHKRHNVKNETMDHLEDCLDNQFGTINDTFRESLVMVGNVIKDIPHRPVDGRSLLQPSASLAGSTLHASPEDLKLAAWGFVTLLLGSLSPKLLNSNAQPHGQCYIHSIECFFFFHLYSHSVLKITLFIYFKHPTHFLVLFPV